MPRFNQTFKQIATRRQRHDRLMTGALLLAAGALTLSFFFGDMGLVHFSKMETMLHKYQREVQALDQANRALFDELTALKTNRFYLEQLARERLGYIKKGELSYEFYDP